MIETYREGKTPGSILCGLVYVTTQKIPLLDNCLLFSFSRHCDIMHHHASVTLHVFKVILWYNLIFILTHLIL
jgi:hypothetical protein